MTTIRTRCRAAFLLTVAVLAGVTVSGCGMVRGGGRAVDTADVLGGFAERLSEGQQSVHTATYRVGGGGPVTVVRRASEAAFLTDRALLIVTAEHLIRCREKICERAPTSARAATDALADVAGPGFVPVETALATVAAAALAPGAKAKPGRQTIAGHEADCVEVTRLAVAGPGASEPPTAAPDPAVVPGDFTVCLTDTDVLAAFRGTLPTGRPVEVELTRLDQVAAPTSFTPPPGAVVTDVPELTAG
jgi:hypothetical protein